LLVFALYPTVEIKLQLGWQVEFLLRINRITKTPNQQNTMIIADILDLAPAVEFAEVLTITEVNGKTSNNELITVQLLALSAQ
jgi:hypothetical protein